MNTFTRRACLAVPLLLATWLCAVAGAGAQSARPSGVTGSTRSLETMTMRDLKAVNAELARTEDSLALRLEQLKRERVAAGLPPLDAGVFGSILTPPPALVDSVGARAIARVEAHAATVRATSLYVTLLAIAPFINTVRPFDVDAGGYVDTWRSDDKLEHAMYGAFASSAGAAIGAHWSAQVLAPCAAAAWWEYSQGYFSSKDLAVTCGAALATTGLTAAFRRISR
jgi:hypothetical protein